MWENIHPKIREVSEDIANQHKFDTAILEAFRYVEGEIQERISSKSIGQNLINEAFDDNPPKIHISDDSRNNEGVKNLFLGSLGLIRNDRAHKKAPLLPCTSMEICLQYLAFASLLLYLLSKDKNILPQITGLRLLGTTEHPRVELRGENFAQDVKLITEDSTELKILKNTATEIEAELPVNFDGKIKVSTGENESNSMPCDVRALDETSENVYQVISTDIPLYEDELCTKLYRDVVGILLRSMEGGLDFQRISPTETGKYQAGIYVTHGPFKDSSIEEAWYRHPVTNDIEYAWSGSLIMIPEIIGKVGMPELIGISIIPKKVQTQPKEKRSLRVIASLKDGNVRLKKDVTGIINKWNSNDESIAFVKNGTLIPKKFGKTKIECQHEGFLSSVDIFVENYSKGDIVTYFQGIRNIQQLAVDADNNLYLCNLSSSVYKIVKEGGVSEVARIALKETYPHGIDCLAIDNHRNLYVNNISDRQCLKFEWNGSGYSSPHKIALSAHGTPKSIAIDPNSGDVFVAIMLNQVVRIKPDGSESSFLTRDTAIYLALDSQGRVCIPSSSNHSIDVYTQDGKPVDSIEHGIRETPVGIVIDEKDNIFLLFHESGRLVRVFKSIIILNPAEIAKFKPHPRGIAMSPEGRIFVSAAMGDSLEVIY